MFAAPQKYAVKQPNTVDCAANFEGWLSPGAVPSRECRFIAAFVMRNPFLRLPYDSPIALLQSVRSIRIRSGAKTLPLDFD